MKKWQRLHLSASTLPTSAFPVAWLGTYELNLVGMERNEMKGGKGGVGKILPIDEIISPSPPEQQSRAVIVMNTATLAASRMEGMDPKR